MQSINEPNKKINVCEICNLPRKDIRTLTATSAATTNLINAQFSSCECFEIKPAGPQTIFGPGGGD